MGIMESHHVWWFSLGLFSGAAALYLGRLWSDLCYFVGRRRFQRRTKARLRAEKREWVHTQDAELDSHNPGYCRYCLDGATSSERTRGTPPVPRRS